MKTHAKVLFTLAGALLMSACTWVQPEPGADRIRLLEPHQVSGCEHLANTTVSVRDRVAAVQRSPGKVEEELATLARNSANDINGDTIVPDGPVQDGRRRFIIYYCGDR